MAFYEVCCKCGHVGRSKYVLKTFVLKAKNGKEAAKVARQFPRVKHDHKDAIRYVNEISEERYNEIYKKNAEDSYFMCRNIQEQRLYCDLELFDEVNCDNRFVDSSEDMSRKPVYSGKTKIKNPHKYFKYYKEYEYVA